MLVHSPCTTIAEHDASCCPHFFELKKNPFSQEERQLILDSRLSKVKHNALQAATARAETWAALEQAFRRC